ncbi:hypothetical protein SacmaDRAFT_0433 [Saccharomonospora marina XMU15]|uniref:DUF4328 domain-containing protein n=1 Tax=Saccharomonospora marina XMU15 TaxID=882083 RepID=H5X367_9PSEU|nr:DUF4328 domain-containing protein [Saccharomonospora marina]EHR48736.1 hypothetical protein SacmaDRAFT_0433 [Saccharomonospora marina XMU15]
MTYPQPAPVPAMPARPLRKVGTIGTAAAVLIGLETLAELAISMSDRHTYTVVNDYVNGEPGVTEADLYAADDIALGVGLSGVGILLAAAVVFLVWLWRVRQNAELLSPLPHRRARGWVIGGWFCPVVNLWFPFQVVSDIWRASRPEPKAGVALLRWWWALLMLSSLIDRYTNILLRGEVTVADLRRVSGLSAVSTLLNLGAGILIILAIRRINAWQEQQPRPLPVPA